jgi:anthranilate/para-aminobenzoate synthase component II
VQCRNDEVNDMILMIDNSNRFTFNLIRQLGKPGQDRRSTP